MRFRPGVKQICLARRARSGGADGFGLLEVLVATSLMGLVLVVLLQVLTSAMRAQETSWKHTQALLVAEKVLEENCEMARLAAGTFQGRVGDYDYLLRIAPQYEIANPFGDRQVVCAVIEIEVSWRERGRLKSLALQTVRTAAQKKS